MKTNILIGIVVIILLVASGGYFLIAKLAVPNPNVLIAENNPPTAPAAEKTVSAPKAEAINPLKLEYTLTNFGPGKSIEIAYYFEKKQQCSGRDAYLGVAKIETIDGKPASQFAKFAAFSDNGEMGISNWNNEENLAFDNAAAYYDDMNIPLFISELFIAAGKNFSDSQYWQADAPIILKNVETGRSKGDYSIINLGDDNGAVVPCTKFKVVVKSTNMDGYFTVCVAKKINEVNLPFVVYRNFQNEQGPGWKLAKVISEKSGFAWTPQCLNAPKCVYAADPTSAEKTQCNQSGGRINPDMDQSGCITRYQCQSETDQAKEAINRTQNPSCDVDQKLLAKYLACRKNNQPNYDPVKYDDNGCLLDINCRP